MKLAKEKRKMNFEKRRLLLVKNKMRQEIIPEENRLMMMDTHGMGKKESAYWEIRRGNLEIKNVLGRDGRWSFG
jgi:hypothetical protein